MATNKHRWWPVSPEMQIFNWFVWTFANRSEEFLAWGNIRQSAKETNSGNTYFSIVSVLFLAHLSRRLKCHPSVHRPSVLHKLTFSTSPLKLLKGIQRYSTGSNIFMSSTKFLFFRPIRKTRWPPWPLIGWDIVNFSSETTKRNSTKLDRKQNLNVLYQVCVFRAILKNKMAA